MCSNEFGDGKISITAGADADKAEYMKMLMLFLQQVRQVLSY